MVQIVDFGAGFWALDFGSWILDFGLLSVIQQFFLCRFWTLILDLEPNFGCYIT